MCRNIKPLFNFEPVATDEELRAAALQFARKLSGMSNPSMANQEAIDQAVDEFAQTARSLLNSLQTTSQPKDRIVEAEKQAARIAHRFGPTTQAS